MRYQLLTVLGISSVLLGLYILVVSLFNMTSTPDYHIGCYLSHQTLDNSYTFKTRLAQLTNNGQHSRHLDSRVKTTQLIDPHLHKKSVDLTKNVEKYIEKLVIIKHYQNSNAEFFAELAMARQTYQNCAIDLQSNFNTEDCKSLWSSYKKCFDNYDILKQELKKLHSERAVYVDQIDRLVAWDPVQPLQRDLEEKLRKIKQKYDRENEQNDRNKERHVSELKRLQMKNQTKSYDYDENQRKNQRSKTQYESCMRNLKQFRNCQDIAKKLNQYGHAESWESLEHRILAKREMLMKLQNLEIQSRGFGDNTAIKQMCTKRQEELKQLIRLRVNIDADEWKQCGCDQKQRRKLQQQYEQTKIIKGSILRDLRQLSEEIITVEQQIRKADKMREKLINDFIEQTQEVKRKQSKSVISLQEVLTNLKLKLSLVNSQITDFSRKTNSIQFECNQYKDKMALQVLRSDEVGKCRSKKDFYNQLKSKAEQILRKDDSSYLEYKNNIVSILNGIDYPKQIQEIKIEQQRETVDQEIIDEISFIDHGQQTQTIQPEQDAVEQDFEHEEYFVQETEVQETEEPVFQKVTIKVEEIVTIKTQEF